MLTINALKIAKYIKRDMQVLACSYSASDSAIKVDVDIHVHVVKPQIQTTNTVLEHAR
jgi:hypothetical protein